MLVESVDGEHALLGRPRSLRRRGPVLTCLSGFIEQGESIEEAVIPPDLQSGIAIASTRYQPPSLLSRSLTPAEACYLMLHCIKPATGDKGLGLICL